VKISFSPNESDYEPSTSSKNSLNEDIFSNISTDKIKYPINYISKLYYLKNIDKFDKIDSIRKVKNINFFFVEKNKRLFKKLKKSEDRLKEVLLEIRNPNILKLNKKKNDINYFKKVKKIKENKKIHYKKYVPIGYKFYNNYY
jgi:hypothetical protein